MSKAFLDDLASGFKQQHQLIAVSRPESQGYYIAQLKDDTITTATLIVKHFPEVDIDEWYDLAGYPGTHPMHEIQRSVQHESR